MTLTIAWRSAQGIHMAADSRLNFNEVYIDQAVKVVSTPYCIRAAGNPQTADILAEGELGMCFAGSAIAALTLCEALRDVLTQMQGAPPYSDVGMDGIVDLLWRTYDILEGELCSALYEYGLAKVIVAGYCATQHRQRAFLFDVEDEGQRLRSKREILDRVGDHEMIGKRTGREKAVAALPSTPSQRDYLNALSMVIDDEAEPTVGGAVQYGELRANRFRVMGVAKNGERVVHYWRSGLDLNNDLLTSGNGLVLNYPLLDLDQP